MADTKRCSKCGLEYPATAEFFYRDASKPHGLHSHCKQCRAAEKREYSLSNKERKREYNRQWRENNPDKERERHRRNYLKNRERILALAKERVSSNPDDKKISALRYRERNSDKLKEKKRAYRQEHSTEERYRSKAYRQSNKEKEAERYQRWRKNNPNKAREKLRRYRAKKAALPFNFTAECEARALEYFNGCCAVCKGPLCDLFGEIEPHFDHWIPISDPREDNPGTVPTNMVPLCSSCNCSKHNADPAEWLKSKFGPRKAKQVLQRIETYFKSLTD